MRIDGSGLHPITCLTSLSRQDKKSILEEGIVLCRDLNEDILRTHHLAERKIQRTLQECEGITGR